MLDALKTLFEGNVISEEIRADIEEAWEKKLHENKMQATAELREEFARKYEHDKQTMVESIDTMLGESLAEEIAEFQEDRKQLSEAKAKFAIAQRKNANLMKSFVSEQLAKKSRNYTQIKKVTKDKFVALEEFVVESLAKELAEFYEDKKDLAETKVRLVREGKAHVNKVKTEFIKKSAALVSETVSKGLKKEISALKEDIDQARENDFGRKLFEAFANEYQHSYLNESSETSKLLKVVDTKDKQIVEARQAAAKAIKLAEAKSIEVKSINETNTRKDTINALVSPLSKDQRDIMTDLLESVQTSRLRASFDKYLPAVIDGNTPAKKKAVLSEAKEVTGNRTQTNDIKADADNNVVDLKRLAGL